MRRAQARRLAVGMGGGRKSLFTPPARVNVTASNAYDPLRPRVLGIYGGKLTAWRATAGQVMEKIETSLPRRRPRAATEELMLRRSV